MGLGAMGKQGHLGLCFPRSLFLVFSGMVALLSLAMATFTQEPQLYLSYLSQRGSILMSNLKHLLSPSFLHHLSRE
jgi:hypothetical protein